MQVKNLVIISGPTAVGKTQIIVEISKVLPIEVISMDSRQVYKEMDIGTAKPLEESKIVKHHMIDIIYPNEYYNAFMYREQALEVYSRVRISGKIPIFVGGTGLYIDALVKGIFEGAPRDENIRRELSNLHQEQPGILRTMLEKFDPEYAQKIHPNDLKRTIRALEVYYILGKKMSELQVQNFQRDFTLIVFNIDREKLYERINLRVDKMIEAGLLAEVERLVNKYGAELNAFKTIGYQELIQYLNGKLNLNEAIHFIKRNTRHYARRQLIWLRRYENAIWIDVEKKSSAIDKVIEILKSEEKKLYGSTI